VIHRTFGSLFIVLARIGIMHNVLRGIAIVLTELRRIGIMITVLSHFTDLRNIENMLNVVRNLGGGILIFVGSLGSLFTVLGKSVCRILQVAWKNPPGGRCVTGRQFGEFGEEPVAVLEESILVDTVELVPIQVGLLFKLLPSVLAI
jgi:hypothetical protein